MKFKMCLLALALSGLVGFGWYNTFRYKAQYTSELNSYLEKGNSYMEQGYFVEAAEEYKKANEQCQDASIEEIIAYCYYAIDEWEDCDYWLERSKTDGGKTEFLYQALAEYSVHMGDKAGAVRALEEAKEQELWTEDIRAMYYELRSLNMNTFDNYESVHVFGNEYALAKEETDSVLLNVEGNQVFDSPIAIYDASSDEALEEVWKDAKTIFVGLNGMNIIFLDQNGHERVRPEGDYTYIGAPREGKILVKTQESYGYLDYKFNELKSGYEAATNFSNGLAAVKQEGKWVIIDKDFKPINEQQYDDILMDEQYICSQAEGVFAKINGKFLLVSKDGTVLLEDIDSAKCFTGVAGYAAVKKDGTWKLVDSNGAIVYEGEEEELASTNCDIVGYREKDLWGFKFLDHEICIEPAYQEIYEFNSKGYAFVKQENVWSMVKLEVFDVWEENSEALL